MVLIAVLADTHGVLDPLILSSMRSAGVAHILHAGDITDAPAKRLRLPAFLSALKEVAPVTAVRGNTDDKCCSAHELKEHDMCAHARYDHGPYRFFMHHGDRWDADAALAELCPPDGGWRPDGDVLVSGHSHVPQLRRLNNGVLHLNPGSAGPKRFTLPRQ
jgi:putative phosphoesterase